MALDAATGAWTFTLSRRSTMRLAATRTTSRIDFGGLVQATDRDGDTVTATGTVTVVVDDDIPAAVAGNFDGDGGRGQAAGRHRGWRGRCRCGRRHGRACCDGFGDGPVPAGSGRSAELWLQHRRHAAGGSEFGRGCAELHHRGEPDHGDGGAAGRRCSRWRSTRRPGHGRSRCLRRWTIRRAATRTISASISAAWSRRPTRMATR